MLEGFPAETPVIRCKKEPAELEGFYSETSLLIETSGARADGIDHHPVVRPRRTSGTLMGGFFAAGLLVAVGIALAWRPTLEPSVLRSNSESSLMVRNAESPPLPRNVEPPVIEVPVGGSAPVVRVPEPVRPQPNGQASREASAYAGFDAPAIPVAAPTYEEPLPVVASAPKPLPPSLSENTDDFDEGPRALPVPARTDAAPVAVEMTVSEEPAIRQVINQYRVAYEKLDATAAKQVWPSVNERALARAFSELQSQILTLQPCRIDVTGNGARALCRGHARYVGRVGNKASSAQSREWRFALSKTNGAWQIDSVRSEEPAYGSNE